jgi:large subunit ribosomal protein L9
VERVAAHGSGVPSVEVILRAPVKGLGEAGATVDVAPGYARNYLFPRGLAEPATPENARRAADARERQERQAARALARAKELAERLQGQTVVVRAKAGESGRLFGSVTAQDVADALAAQYGAEVDRRRLELDQPIKTLGSHPVTVRLHPEIAVEVTVRVEPL